VFPGLSNHALLSIGTFCDAGCIAIFTATEVIIQHKGNTVLIGNREPPGLWTIDLNKPAQPAWQANAMYTTQLKTNAIKFLHATCFSPTTVTWTKAIDKGFFSSWPKITTTDVCKLLPKSLATTMGHLDQQRKNLRSTKPNPGKPKDDTEAINDSNPPIDDKTNIRCLRPADRKRGDQTQGQSARPEREILGQLHSPVQAAGPEL
jgi:hypothetical protein